MATISLGSGLVEKITKKVFSDVQYSQFTSGYNYNTDFSLNLDAKSMGMGGYGGTQTGGSGNYGIPVFSGINARPTYFSLMGGVVPSAISDVSSNQRSADELVRFTGPQPNYDLNATLTTSIDTTIPHSSNYITKNDFLITVTGNQATWSALNLSFLPRYPITSGTPTWFWMRTYSRQHNIIGTVGATGSGSDLELQTYGYIDASKEYTLYNATMAVFEMTQEINY